ncbi:MAG TPA: VWA domain-containing protein [Vicinamibacterales bacterium]|nr:VWA domain-containing protein [Vicinamibacterales bacterium]
MPAPAPKIRPTLLTLTLGAAAAWLLAPALHARAPVRAETKAAFAIALDATSNPITDLTKDDWGVREDGQNRKLIDAKPATDPLTIVVLVDMTRWVQSSLKDMRTALTTFTHAIQAAQPTAQIAIVGFSTQSQTLVELGKTAADIDKAIAHVVADQSGQSTVMLEAFMDAAKKLAQAPSPRRAIVTLNLDGFDETSSVQPQNVASAVLATRASLWAVSFKNSESARVKGQGGQSRDQVLNNLTSQTGGVRLTVGTSNVLEPQLQKVAQVLLAQYLVTYERPEGPAPKLLQMAVARPGAQMLVPKVPPQ